MRIWKAAALAATMTIATPALAGTQDFTVINGTGKTINYIYVSPSTADDWQEDVLHDDVLSAGGRFKISFDRSETACLWDLKVVYDTGRNAVWNAIDLCKVSVVALRYNSSTGRTTIATE